MNKKEHMERTLKKFGFEAEDIQSFMDEPVRVYRKGHGGFRHDTETIKLVGNLFGAKYTREIAENIALDHIIADHEEEIGDRTERTKEKDSGSQLQLKTTTTTEKAFEDARACLANCIQDT